MPAGGDGRDDGHRPHSNVGGDRVDDAQVGDGRRPCLGSITSPGAYRPRSFSASWGSRWSATPVPTCSPTRRRPIWDSIRSSKADGGLDRRRPARPRRRRLPGEGDRPASHRRQERDGPRLGCQDGTRSSRSPAGCPHADAGNSAAAATFAATRASPHQEVIRPRGRRPRPGSPPKAGRQGHGPAEPAPRRRRSPKTAACPRRVKVFTRGSPRARGAQAFAGGLLESKPGPPRPRCILAPCARATTRASSDSDSPGAVRACRSARSRSRRAACTSTTSPNSASAASAAENVLGLGTGHGSPRDVGLAGRSDFRKIAPLTKEQVALKSPAVTSRGEKLLPTPLVFLLRTPLSRSYAMLRRSASPGQRHKMASRGRRPRHPENPGRGAIPA